MDKLDPLWVNAGAPILAAVIGSILIVVNEWVKIFFEKKRQKEKLRIWTALEQTGPVQRLLTLENLSAATGLSGKNITPLIYEMLQEGTVSEGSRPGTFARFKT